jgi:hypothetical protein
MDSNLLLNCRKERTINFQIPWSRAEGKKRDYLRNAPVERYKDPSHQFHSPKLKRF